MAGNDVVEGTDNESDVTDDVVLPVERGVRSGMGSSCGSERGVTAMCCTCTRGVAGGSSEESRRTFFSGCTGATLVISSRCMQCLQQKG